MPSSILDENIREIIDKTATDLEEKFGGDVVTYYGPIHPVIFKTFRNFVENVYEKSGNKKRLVLFLTTDGGVVETVEKMVVTLRHFYKEIYFVIPDNAMSAGTIFCMSGDKIYMDYSSSLGPIDPQVYVKNRNGEQYVPALGYLDKVKELVQKSADGTLTDAEFALLQNQDLALLRRYEQAKDLSIELLKNWLVTYKFKSWKTHEGTVNPEKKGNNVTKAEKEARAEEIARMLSDNSIWHSHGRMIDMNTLRQKLHLKIEDYTGDSTGLVTLIRQYHDVLTDYMDRMGNRFFMHNRHITF